MIKREMYGDLIELSLKCRFDAIAHGCNCFHTMGAGIANIIKKVYPEAYEADLKTKKGDRNKLGTISIATVKLNTCYLDVINAYTQYDYRITPQNSVNVDYEAIRKAFTVINEKYKGKHIGIPMIGAGLAGGDWNKISSIINEVTSDIDITLVRYKR